jgi:hypothetical protein
VHSSLEGGGAYAHAGLSSGSGSRSLLSLGCHSCGAVGGRRDRPKLFFLAAVSEKRLAWIGAGWRGLELIRGGRAGDPAESGLGREAVPGSCLPTGRPAGDDVGGGEVHAEVGGAAAARAGQAAGGAVASGRQVLRRGERRQAPGAGGGG